MTKITFVDDNDNVIGAGTKEEASLKGFGRRLIRIFLFNSKGELLVQKRADNLKAYPGRWENSVAGHVDEGEEYITAAHRELEEELGVRGVTLRELKKLKFESPTKPGVQHFHMNYALTYDGALMPNKEEISELKWMLPAEVSLLMDQGPEKFAPNFINNFKNLYNEKGSNF